MINYELSIRAQTIQSTRINVTLIIINVEIPLKDGREALLSLRVKCLNGNDGLVAYNNNSINNTFLTSFAGKTVTYKGDMQNRPYANALWVVFKHFLDGRMSLCYPVN